MMRTELGIHSLALLIGYLYGAWAKWRIDAIEPVANRPMYMRNRRLMLLVLVTWPVGQIIGLVIALKKDSGPYVQMSLTEFAITFLVAAGVILVGWNAAPSDSVLLVIVLCIFWGECFIYALLRPYRWLRERNTIVGKLDRANREWNLALPRGLRSSRSDEDRPPKPFYLNTQERREWFAQTSPWDRLAPSVVDAILDGIKDKVLLEAFVLTSMKQNLVGRYEPLGRENDDPTVIRAQISGILSETGLHAIGALEKALEAKQTDAAGNAAALAANTFEPAIALAKNQVAAYIGMAHLCRLAGKRDECHDWAERGLAEHEKMRPYKSATQGSTVLPPDIFDQEEKYLRTLLEY